VYSGLSKVAQRRRDFKYAKDCFKETGIANSFGDGTSGANDIKVTDTSGNSFLLQALGTLDERIENLAEADLSSSVSSISCCYMVSTSTTSYKKATTWVTVWEKVLSYHRR
jgi:hypothetical protein